MGVGKYSPTVSAAYGADQEWHRKLRTEETCCDDEGYDSYGYHELTGFDRAGNHRDLRRAILVRKSSLVYQIGNAFMPFRPQKY